MEDERKALWLSIVSLAITICVGFLPLWEAAPLFLKQVAPWVALVSGIVALVAVYQYARLAGWFSWFGNLPWVTWRWHWFTTDKPRAGNQTAVPSQPKVPAGAHSAAGRALLDLVAQNLQIEGHPVSMKELRLLKYKEEYLQELGEGGAGLLVRTHDGDIWAALAQLEREMKLHAESRAARKDEPPV